MVDAHYKWTDIIPVSSGVTIEKFRLVFVTHGLPNKVVTDNESVCTSVISSREIESLSAQYHPASNGLDKRAIETFRTLFE